MKHTGTICLAASLLIACAAVALSCTKQGDTTNPTVQNITNSGCNHHTDHQALSQKDPIDAPDSVAIDYSEGILYVTHFNLLVNCAFESSGIDVNLAVDGNTITIEETEHDGPLADCICRTNNSFQIANLPHGTYTLVFRSWYPSPHSVTVTI